MSRGRNVYLPVASPGYIRRYGMPVNPEDLKLHTENLAFSLGITTVERKQVVEIL